MFPEFFSAFVILQPDAYKCNADISGEHIIREDIIKITIIITIIIIAIIIEIFILPILRMGRVYKLKVCVCLS